MINLIDTKNEQLKCEKVVYELCSEVFQKKAFSSIILDKALKKENFQPQNAAYITNFFYGVLDHSIEFDYILSVLVPKKPKPAAAVLLKMGLYLLRYSSTPPYAAVDKIVELSKASGKGGVSGFINAVLKKSQNIVLPQISDENTLSINSSTPLWLVNTLIFDYGFDFTKKLLCHKNDNLTHIRVNRFNISNADFALKYGKILENPTKYGYYVTHSTIEKLSKSDYVIQSYASIAAVDYFYDGNAGNILDLCAAPGGKAVLMKERSFTCGKNAEIIACDIHPHRVELIKKYAGFTGAELNTVQNDATVLKEDWIEKFDLVLCDVPCSGIGVEGSKPEIVLNKDLKDVDELAKIQKNIINTAKNYVKKGGYLCYSTCTILKKENDDIIEAFLKENDNFIIHENYMRLFPHMDDCDGFFAAKLKKVR